MIKRGWRQKEEEAGENNMRHATREALLWYCVSTSGAQYDKIFNL